VAFDTGWGRNAPVGKVLELLKELEPTDVLHASPIKGNLAIFRDDWYIGYLDLAEEKLDLIPEEQWASWNEGRQRDETRS
jgi:hypothetical protein